MYFKKRRKTQYRNISDIIEKRYIFIFIIIILCFSLIMIRLFYLEGIKDEDYKVALSSSKQKIITSSSSPRGRIYDRNYNLLVDNEAVKTIYYKKPKGITSKEEVSLAYKMSEILDIDYSKQSEDTLKEFWILLNEEDARDLITDKEKKLYNERKLNDDDLLKLKKERITNEDLDKLNDLDKEASYLYYLMNKGYSYAEKIIKNKNVTEEEYAYVSENINLLSGFNTKLDWERIYLYGNTFKTILGKVSSDSQGIPKEVAEDYLKKGYSLNDRVGISYLEYQYEDYLKGEKATYRLNSDNSYELVSPGKRGNDIVITIDINLQQSVEDILKEEVYNAKGEVNTDYYNRSFVIVSDPKTGEVLAMAGKQVLFNDDGSKYIVDYTPGVFTLPVTPGSIVKGASIAVGYKYGAIDIGTVMYDECIKIKNTKEKCSWRNLGSLNDIKALQLSSNIYQFKIAMKVAGATYEYDEPLSIDKSAFNKYRDMYASFGLGVKTNIDLPLESIGYKGDSTLPGHLLDFSIGQYDTYTPLQLSVYINTIANSGTRLKPYLVKAIYAPSVDGETVFGENIYKKEPEVVGTVSLDEKYMKRIQEGFYAVMQGSLGYGYMGLYNYSAGKTGTSQSFIDTDGDNIVDTETITSTFGGYAPYDNPKMSIVTVSPDVAHNNSNISYTSSVNKRITAKVTNKFFEIYK